MADLTTKLVNLSILGLGSFFVYNYFKCFMKGDSTNCFLDSISQTQTDLQTGLIGFFEGTFGAVANS